MTVHATPRIDDHALRAAIRDLDFAGKPSAAVVAALQALQAIGHLAALALEDSTEHMERMSMLARIRTLAGN